MLAVPIIWVEGGKNVKILFTFFIPSGGVETLNRMRCRVLKHHGVEAHLLYNQEGTGLKNISDIPVFITSSDQELKHILDTQRYDAAIVTSDFLMTARLRNAGFIGPILYEGQGFGMWKDAYLTVMEAEPFIRRHTTGILMPPTAHLAELFDLLCPGVPRFVFPNMIDLDRFSPRQVPPPPEPIIGWIGRLEPNKNWSEFLHICHQILPYKPNMSIRMYTDETLASPEQRNAFGQLVQELKLNAHLHTLNSVPNVLSLFLHCGLRRAGHFDLQDGRIRVRGGRSHGLSLSRTQHRFGWCPGLHYSRSNRHFLSAREY
jgi:L-malate glycosyltransferase